MQLPIIFFVGESAFSKRLVKAMRGSWMIMPTKAMPVTKQCQQSDVHGRQAWLVRRYHSPMKLWVGIPTASSCRNAETKNTMNAAE